jgi:hypothetical protein
VGTVENGRRWCSGGRGGGGWWWVWVVLDLGRGRTDKVFRGGCCTAEGKMGEGGKKCDLKAGHAGLKLSMFERP